MGQTTETTMVSEKKNGVCDTAVPGVPPTATTQGGEETSQFRARGITESRLPAAWADNIKRSCCSKNPNPDPCGTCVSDPTQEMPSAVPHGAATARSMYG